MKHCVTTCEEWKDVPDALILKDLYLPSGKQHSSADEEELSNRHKVSPAYEMASILFEPLLGVVDSDPPEKSTQNEASKSNEKYFMTDVMQLQASAQAPHGKTRFLQSVVRHFAKAVGADLITLKQNDLEDLADYLRQTEKGSERVGCLSFLFDRPVSSAPSKCGSEVLEGKCDGQIDKPDPGINQETSQALEELSHGLALSEVSVLEDSVLLNVLWFFSTVTSIGQLQLTYIVLRQPYPSPRFSTRRQLSAYTTSALTMLKRSHP